MSTHCELENWCVGCDKSSVEVKGAYFNYSWWCEECVDKGDSPKPTLKEVNKQLRGWIKLLDKGLKDENN